MSGTTIGTKCDPSYVCIFTDKVETKFLETQRYKPFWCINHISDILFIWT